MKEIFLFISLDVSWHGRCVELHLRPVPAPQGVNHWHNLEFKIHICHLFIHAITIPRVEIALVVTHTLSFWTHKVNSISDNCASK